MSGLDRMPYYLEEDSPARQGAHKLMQPPQNLLEIPGREINSAVLNKMPATYRSKKIAKEMATRMTMKRRYSQRRDTGRSIRV